MSFRILLPVFLLSLSLQSCFDDKRDQLYPTPSGGCDTTNVQYSAFVKQIVSTNCSGCHSATSKAAGGNIALDTHADLKVMASNGKLVPAINHTGPFPMPQGGNKLDDCTIAKISAWVNAGAPNN